MTDQKIVEDFVDWLRAEGYFMKKVNALGNEAFVPTQELVETYRLAGGFGKAAARRQPVEEPALF
jgi:hypothetical protein